MKPILKWSAILAVVVVVPTLIFYTVLNRRGTRAWAEMETYLESEGETFKFRDLLPPQPVGAENFGAIPLVASMTNFEWYGDDEITYRDPGQHDRIAAMKIPYPQVRAEIPLRGDFRNGDLPDFEGWAKFFREIPEFHVPDPSAPPAEQILDALRKFESQFAELGAAAKRPWSVFAIEWPEEGEFFRFVAMPSPYLTEINDLSKLLNLRAVAALAAGKPETARESIDVIFDLAEAAGGQPTLIHCLVAITARSLALSAIWYGLHERVWREEDLVWLEREFRSIENYDSAVTAFRGEMLIFQVFLHDFYLRMNPDALPEALGNVTPLSVLYVRAFPKGFWLLGKSEGCRYLYDGIIRPLKAENTAALVGLANFPLPEERKYNRFVLMTLPAIDIQGRNVVRMRTLATLARTACALERFYLKNGGYPDEDLGQLEPDFLEAIPVDPLDGNPVRYVPTKDGRYRLYSIGPNLTDEGGWAEFLPGRSDPKKGSGDWVWSYSYPERDSKGGGGAGRRKIVFP